MADSTAIIAAVSALGGVIVSSVVQFWVSKYTFRLQEQQSRRSRLYTRYEALAAATVYYQEAMRVVLGLFPKFGDSASIDDASDDLSLEGGAYRNAGLVATEAISEVYMIGTLLIMDGAGDLETDAARSAFHEMVKLQGLANTETWHQDTHGAVLLEQQQQATTAKIHELVAAIRMALWDSGDK